MPPARPRPQLENYRQSTSLKEVDWKTFLNIQFW
jgi:hypothetical protein